MDTTREYLIDRWATFYVYEHEGTSWACACPVIYNTFMNDAEKQEDIKARRDQYGFDKNKVVALISRARKKGRTKELLAKSIRGNGLEGDMFSLNASIIERSGTSVSMMLRAVTDQGVDCQQWFGEEEFNKRFKQQNMENEKKGGNGLDA